MPYPAERSDKLRNEKKCQMAWECKAHLIILDKSSQQSDESRKQISMGWGDSESEEINNEKIKNLVEKFIFRIRLGERFFSQLL